MVLTTPKEQIYADLSAGYDYLRQLEEINPERIGAVGFCFGGTQVMHMGTRRPELAATVIFYGSDPITDPASLGGLGESGPVLGIYGENDRQIPLAEVYAFGEAMVERDIRHRITVYPDVGHAFVTYEAIFTPGPAQDAWEEMLDFLAEALQP
jgi:carboxymethylenebutenolidase